MAASDRVTVAGNPPQVDYRASPSAPQPSGESGHAQGYGQALDTGAFAVAPPTDQTWKSYDAEEDATRFNGINTPEQQDRLLANPPPSTSGVIAS